MPAFKQHRALLLILGCFTLWTLYQSLVLPLGEAADETDHYQYLRFVARTGHPPLTGAERNEAGFKGGLAPLYYWLTAWPVALVGEDSLPEVRRVDARPERHIPTDGLGINHVLHTLDEAWPWQGQVLAWHLVRLLSLPMAWVTVIASYALARRLRPDRPAIAVGAAFFVAFLPRFVISSAVINDDNLVFALTALLLLLQVAIWQEQAPPSPRRLALLGGLFGLALVTKYFSLILVPELVLTLGIALKKVKNSPGFGPGRVLGPFLLALLLTAGPWFSFILLRFNRVEELGWIAGLAASLGEPQVTEGLVGLLSGQSVRPPAATYPLPEWAGLLYRSFWFEYGWMRLFAPTWLYLLFTLFSLLALAGLIGKIRLNPERTPASSPFPSSNSLLSRFTLHISRFTLHASRFPPLLSLHLALFLVVVLTRYVLSATLDTGQGRHLYPALPVVALLVALGWDRLGRTFPWRGPRLPALGYLLLLGLPALVSLSPAWATQQGRTVIQPSRFISPHYQVLPVTTRPVSLPAGQHLDLEFAPGLSLLGFESETAATAGSTLPVKLYWQAGAEATAGYFYALCLDDEAGQPAACWAGHFAGGAYPARAWEPGDTLIDPVAIPIPACDWPAGRTYRLRLTLWTLSPTSAATALQLPPLLEHRFEGPAITLQPAGSGGEPPRPAELWAAGERLAGPATLGLRQSLAYLLYDPASAGPAAFELSRDPTRQWQPLSEPLSLPCAGGPEPEANLFHFTVEPDLPPGTYQPGPESSLPALTLRLRDRVFAPVTTSLTFSQTLAPLELQVPGQRPLELSGTPPVAPPQLSPGTVLPVTIRWQARRWMAEPLVLALKLLDKDFEVGGERIATLGDRYPNVLWAPGELIEETYPVRLNPAAPPGLYRLEISLLQQDPHLPEGYGYLPLTEGETPAGQNLYPLTFRLFDPAHGMPPSQPLQAQLGDRIRLAGYDLNPNFSDSPPSLALTLYWESSAPPGQDYTVFTQLIGPDGQLWAQWDNPPQAGRYPTSAWTAVDIIVDRYHLTLREGAPPGPYRLLAGMYDPTTGQRLPVTLSGEPQPDGAVPVATVVREGN